VAGAGSGKTGTLVEYLLRFLEDNPRERSLTAILALTFTEKAATEMRERIGRSLWVRLREAEAAGDSQARAYWEKEIRALGQARISTIHSYALSLVSDYSFYLSLPPGLKTEEGSPDGDLKEVLTDALDQRDPRFLEFLKYMPLTGFSSSLPSVRSVLTLALVRLSGWGLPGLTAPSSDFDPPPLDDLLEDYRTKREALGLLLADGLKSKKRAELEVLAAETCLFELAASYRKLPETLADELAGILGQVTEHTASVSGISAKNVTGALGPLLDSRNRLLRYFSDVLARPLVSLLVKASELIVSRTEKKRLSRGSLSFDDILIFARRLLQSRAQVREAERRRWQLVAVDEFQDTNRLQADLLAQILGPPESAGRSWSELDFRTVDGKLRVFGDSKQSIYKFRGAEPEIMNGLAGLLPQNQGGEVLELDTNYRTQAGLVDFYNKFFSGQLRGELFYEQKSVRPRLYEGPQVAWLTDENDKNKFNSAAWKSRQSRIVAVYLRQLFSGEAGVLVGDRRNPDSAGRLPQPGDVAVLLRYRKYAHLYENAVLKAGIPCRTLKGADYFDYPEVRGLTGAYLFLAGRAPSYYLAALLTSPLGPVEPDTLERMVRNGDSTSELADYFTPRRRPFPDNLARKDLGILTELRELLLALKPLINRRPPGEILETIVEARGLLPVVVSGPGGSWDRVKLVQKFLGIVKGLPYHSQSKAACSEDLIADLWEAGLSMGADAEAVTLEEDPVPEAVNILTIHQSKGLEFPVVIIPETDIPLSSRNDHLIIDGCGRMAVRLTGSRGLLFESWAYEAFKDEKDTGELAEHKRLFYVAATRARDHLAVTGKVAKNTVRGRASEESAKNWLYPLVGLHDFSTHIKELSLWPGAGDEPGRPAAEEPKSAVSPAGPLPGAADDFSGLEPGLLGPLPERSTLHTSVTFYCRRLAGSSAPFEVDPGLEKENKSPLILGQGQLGPEGPTSAAQRGILFHALLEATDYSWDGIKFKKCLEELAGRHRLVMSGPEKDFLVDRALAFQESNFGREARAALESGAIVWREKGFWLKLEEPGGPVILTGIMDLFYVRPDGAGQIVDYKLANPGHLDIYQKQVEIYKTAIRQAGFEEEILASVWFAA
jgi:ATP-dependent helicase/nuclease subunit A